MTNEQLDDLRFLVNHKSWTDFFVPLLRASREFHLRQLADPAENRLLDDYRRAVIAVVETMAENPLQLIEEMDSQQQALASQESMEVEYALRADMGRFAPFSDRE